MICAAAALVSHFTVGLTAGPSYVFQASQSDGLALTAFNAETLLVCFTHVSRGYGGACRVLARSAPPSASTLFAGPLLMFNIQETRDIAMARLSATLAFACYKNIVSATGECTAISRTSTHALSTSTRYRFSVAEVSDISVASFGSSFAVICYRDGATALGHGTCKAVHAATTPSAATTPAAAATADSLELSVTNSEPTVFSRSSTRNIAVVSLASSTGVACYRDEGQGDSATCTAFSLEPIPLEHASSSQSRPQPHDNASSAAAPVLKFGPATSVAPTSGYADYISVAAFDSSSAIVCYGRGCKCSLVMVRTPSDGASPGPHLSIGAALAVSDHASRRFSYKAVSTLDASRAVVCFGNEAAAGVNTCSTLSRSTGATPADATPADATPAEATLAVEETLIVSSNPTFFHAVVSPDSSSAVVCVGDFGRVGDFLFIK